MALASRQGANVLACLSLLTRARVLRLTSAEAGPDRRRIEADIDTALALVEQIGARVYEPPLREERARLRGEDGELADVADLYQTIGATGHVHRLKAELSMRSAG